MGEAEGAVGGKIMVSVRTEGSIGEKTMPSVGTEGAVGGKIMVLVRTEGAVGGKFMPLVRTEGAVGGKFMPSVITQTLSPCHPITPHPLPPNRRQRNLIVGEGGLMGGNGRCPLASRQFIQANR